MVTDASTDQVLAELTARKCWALHRLGEVINSGRAAGWLAAAEPLAVASAGEFLLRVEKHIGCRSTPMRDLARGCGLNPLEMDMLWLLAAIEIEPLITRAATALAGPGMSTISVQALQICMNSRSLSASLQHLSLLQLIEIESHHSVPVQRRAVRVSDRVLELAMGAKELDREIVGSARIVRACSTASEAAAGNAAFRNALTQQKPVLLYAFGPDGLGKTDMLLKLASDAERDVIVVDTTALSRELATFERQLRIVTREAMLHRALLLYQSIDSAGDRVVSFETYLQTSPLTHVLATGQHPRGARPSRSVVSVEVKAPGVEIRARLWRQALPQADSRLIADCASRFAIAPAAIADAASIARSTAKDAVTGRDIQSAVSSIFHERLATLATRIEISQTWDDLVLPADEINKIIEFVGRAHHRDHVFTKWGFGAKVGKGLGTTGLFSGPPGTGKTMVAGLIARELGLDLYQIDLSAITSKYIGETEKQLATLFNAAEAGHALLLFDEADSVFGKRSEVKSSNDRYANLAVNYLLQRLEAFSGVAILTTNHENAIDDAFMRRLSLHVRIPLPDVGLREQIWAAMIPSSAEVAANLDVRGLAQNFDMSGGYIKNAVLRAAFLAASEGTSITNDHLLRAANAEYEGLGKLMFQPECSLAA